LSTPSHTVTGGRIVDRAAGFGMPGVLVENGQDVMDVYDAVADAADRARRGDGPTLIEVMTYRFREHSEGLRINVDYRDSEEKALWTSRDPIVMFREELIAEGISNSDEMDAIEAEIEQEVEDCATFALESPDPDPSIAFQHLYTDEYELEGAL